MTKFIQEEAKVVTCSTRCSGRVRGGSRHWNRGDTVNKIRLENFRCFRAKQSVRLAPLTLLVGENSTGKTSFLALVRALWDTAYSGTTPDFKEAPYDLGSFDEIAHYRGGRAGRASEFNAGFDGFARNARRHRKVVGSDSGSHRFEASFGRLGTAPIPVRMLFERNDATLTGHFADDMSQAIRFRTRKRRVGEDGGSAVLRNARGPTILDGAELVSEMVSPRGCEADRRFPALYPKR